MFIIKEKKLYHMRMLITPECVCSHVTTPFTQCPEQEAQLKCSRDTHEDTDQPPESILGLFHQHRTLGFPEHTRKAQNAGWNRADPLQPRGVQPCKGAKTQMESEKASIQL